MRGGLQAASFGSTETAGLCGLITTEAQNIKSHTQTNQTNQPTKKPQNKTTKTKKNPNIPRSKEACPPTWIIK